jgi:ornithine cyclodeaminase/alanine dehydrogenase-like protein (mu-crystallin family)
VSAAAGELRLISAAEVRTALPIGTAIEVLAAGFGNNVSVDAPTRQQQPFADGTLLTMPATATVAGEPVGGVKLVTVRAANADLGEPGVQAVYVLFGTPSLRPVALIDGGALTELRTAAVSALATSLLARQDAHRLVLFGAGAQAHAHLQALAHVRPVDEVVVVGRTPARVDALVQQAIERGLRARAGTPDDVAEADIVCTCTTSPDPVFDGRKLPDGVHVVAVGAFQPHTREVDSETVGSTLVVVEQRAAALAEAGDLLLAIDDGRFTAEAIAADLAELCAGVPVRRRAEDRTLFKSVGLALEDLLIADAIHRAATLCVE